MFRFARSLLVLCALVAILMSGSSQATLVTIDDGNDLDNIGLGSGAYGPIGGTNVRSSPGQISAALIEWSGDDIETSSGAGIDTIGDFLTLLDSVKPSGIGSPVTFAIFAFGVQEPGGSSVNITELDFMFDTTVLEFDPGDMLTVFAYNSGGAEAEAYIQVNFGTDLRLANQMASFSISGELTSSDGGNERLFLTDLTTVAIPEPSAFLLGGMVCGLVGLRWAKRGTR